MKTYPIYLRTKDPKEAERLAPSDRWLTRTRHGYVATEGIWRGLWFKLFGRA